MSEEKIRNAKALAFAKYSRNALKARMRDPYGFKDADAWGGAVGHLEDWDHIIKLLEREAKELDEPLSWV